ncbi:MAG TPA: hypothetical protein VFB14_20490 [Bryobacteraceae bacterium]|jgi:hypothetical protein|nr:hypothetical protein [Bryobacteraceae bacterium]
MPKVDRLKIGSANRNRIRPKRRACPGFRLGLLSGLVLTLCMAPASAENVQSVRLGPDGRFFVNGAAIFPIGYTSGPTLGAIAPTGRDGLAELKREGYVFQLWYCPPHTWGPEKEAQLDSLVKLSETQGTRLVISIPDLQAIKPGDQAKIAELQRVVKKYRNSPAILFWKGEDEPQWGHYTPEDLRIYYQTVHELDPNHPIWITQAPRGTVEQLRPYSQFFDIGAIDIYPISYPPGTHSGIANKNLSVVGDYTRIIADATDHQKALMMILQICWSGVTKPGKTLRFPTFPDERYMTYEAIINGARALVYFGGNVHGCWNDFDTAYGWNWTFYDRVLRPVLDELRPDSPLYPALIAPNSTLPVKVDGAGIEYTVREAGDFIYILASKREGDTIEATFSGLPPNVTGGDVLFEAPRKVTQEEGRFIDWFGPNEVHAYRFRRH